MVVIVRPKKRKNCGHEFSGFLGLKMDVTITEIGQLCAYKKKNWRTLPRIVITWKKEIGIKKLEANFVTTLLWYNNLIHKKSQKSVC